MIVNIWTYTDAGFARTFTYKDKYLDPVDLTDVVLHMHIRAKAADATVFVALSSADGDASAIVIEDAANGKFSIAIPYATLTRLPVGEYAHSLISTDIEGNRHRVWRGTLTHAAGPTRWGSS